MKLSAPLAKGLRTSEGWLIYGSNIVLVAAAALPHGLSWTKSGLYLAILNAAYAISRSGVKAAAALNQDLGVAGGPVAPNDVPGPDVVLAQIQSFEHAVAAFQDKPGTPAEQVVHGLSPEPRAPVVQPEPQPVIQPVVQGQPPIPPTA